MQLPRFVSSFRIYPYGALHQEFGLPNSVADSWFPFHGLQCICRLCGRLQDLTCPGKVGLLNAVHVHLNFFPSIKVLFPATCLTIFPGLFFKKSIYTQHHLIPLNFPMTFYPQNSFVICMVFFLRYSGVEYLTYGQKISHCLIDMTPFCRSCLKAFTCEVVSPKYLIVLPKSFVTKN